MKEEILRFGKNNELVGTITYPDNNINGDGLPAFILWNAGLIHRIGPYRLNVDLARKVSYASFTSFRFDMSRKGDSEKGDALKSYMQLAASNLNEAMDFINKKIGSKNFILIGFCSGADQLHPVALSDQRVSGAVFLDGYGYRTFRYHIKKLKYYSVQILRNIVDPKKLKKTLKNKLNYIFSKSDSDMTEDEYLFRPFPPKKNTRKDIIQMLDRGMNLLYVYTGGVEHYYNYRTQFQDMFGINIKKYPKRLQVEYFKKANHTYAFIEDRVKLIDLISDWAHENYIKKIGT